MSELSGPARCVAEFHEAFRCPVRQPFDPDSALFRLRADLGVEEAREAADAPTLANLTKELADQVYVAYGTALTYGIDLDAAIEAVHRSNMSKLDENGEPVYRADGKVLKSSLYREADVSAAMPVLCAAAGCVNPWVQDLLCYAHERLMHAGLLDPEEAPALPALTGPADVVPAVVAGVPADLLDPAGTAATAVRPVRLTGAGWTCPCGRRNRVAVRLCGSCRADSPLTEADVRLLQGTQLRT